MDIAQHLATLFVLAALIGLTVYWKGTRSRSLLTGWATQNGYVILNSEFRFLRKGPFFWGSSRGQTIYHVTVRDAQQRVRSGWVRCGGFWFGLYTDKTEVRWED